MPSSRTDSASAWRNRRRSGSSAISSFSTGYSRIEPPPSVTWCLHAISLKARSHSLDGSNTLGSVERSDLADLLTM